MAVNGISGSGNGTLGERQVKGHWERTYYCVVCRLALGELVIYEQPSVAFRVKAFKICERGFKIPFRFSS